jgi:HEAT repeat protein
MPILAGLLWYSANVGSQADQPQPTAKPGTAQPSPNDSPKAKVRREDLRYQGKDFGYWCRQLQTELSSKGQVEALQAVAAFGCKGYGAEAIAAMLEFAPASSDIRGAILRTPTGDDGIVYTAVVAAIRQIGPPALDPLTRALSDKERFVRLFAIDAISCLEVPADATSRVAITEALVRAVQDRDKEIRQQAIPQLARMAADPKTVVPILARIAITRLPDDDRVPWGNGDTEVTEVSRHRAVDALCAVGALAGPAESVLWKIAENAQEDRGLRCQALRALTNLKPDQEHAIPVAIRILNEAIDSCATAAGDQGSPQPRVDQATKELAMAAADLLEPYGARSKESVPSLVRLLALDTYSCRLTAARVLGAVGPEASAATGPLEQILSETRPYPGEREKREVKEALQKIDPKRHPSKSGKPTLRTEER